MFVLVSTVIYIAMFPLHLVYTMWHYNYVHASIKNKSVNITDTLYKHNIFRKQNLSTKSVLDTVTETILLVKFVLLECFHKVW